MKRFAELFLGYLVAPLVGAVALGLPRAINSHDLKPMIVFVVMALTWAYITTWVGGPVGSGIEMAKTTVKTVIFFVAFALLLSWAKGSSEALHEILAAPCFYAGVLCTLLQGFMSSIGNSFNKLEGASE